MRTLLVFVLVVAAVAAGFRHFVTQRYEKEQDALRRLKEARLAVQARTERPAWIPGFLDNSFGSVFDRVVELNLSRQTLNEQRGYWQFPENFTDEHVPLVLEFRKLERLNIASTGITSESLKDLATLNGLGELNISGTGIRGDAVADFRRALPACVICRQSDMVEARLSADGEVVIDGRRGRVENASSLLRAGKSGPAAFGHTKLRLYVIVDSDADDEPPEEMIEILSALATKSGYAGVIVAAGRRARQ